MLPEVTFNGSAGTLLVEAIGDVVGQIRDHPLFVKIRQADQELLTTYIVDRLARARSRFSS